jgi:transcriptional regulator with XRE-family HTH domain
LVTIPTAGMLGRWLLTKAGANTPMSDLHPQGEFPPQRAPTPSPTPHEARQIIGERVRAARVAAHLTQQELAGPTYSKSYISAVERGKMTPSFQALSTLAERLGVTRSYLLGEETREQTLETPKEQREDEQQRALPSEAERLLQQGRHEEAIALFEQIGQKDQTSWAHEQYAHFLAEQGRYQEAYEQMRLALQVRG